MRRLLLGSAEGRLPWRDRPIWGPYGFDCGAPELRSPRVRRGQTSSRHCSANAASCGSLVRACTRRCPSPKRPSPWGQSIG